MRLDLPWSSLFSLFALIGALRARFAPPPPKRSVGYALSARVHVALRAAARARR